MRRSLLQKGQRLPKKLAREFVVPMSLRRMLVTSHAEMDDIGVVPVSLTYSVLIHEYLALKNWKRAARLVQEMARKDVKFSFLTVDKVIDAALAAEQVNVARELIELIDQDNTMLTANEQTMTAAQQ